MKKIDLKGLERNGVPMPKCEVKLFQPDVDCDAPPPEVHRREMESTIVWLCDPHNPLLDQAVEDADA